MHPAIYHKRLTSGVRWQRNFRARICLMRHARLQPQTLPMPRLVNNNGCIRGVWERFMRKVRAKYPDQMMTALQAVRDDNSCE